MLNCSNQCHSRQINSNVDYIESPQIGRRIKRTKIVIIVYMNEFIFLILLKINERFEILFDALHGFVTLIHSNHFVYIVCFVCALGRCYCDSD